MEEVRIRVRFFGEIRSVVGRKEDEVLFPHDGKVRNLLALLSRNYGQAFKARALKETGELQEHVAMLVNGRNIDAINGLETKLGSGDVDIIFLGIIEGG